MMFPRAMLRLVWFVSAERLVDCLQSLSETGVFHLAEQYRLGEAQDLEPLERSIQNTRRYQCQRAARHLLQGLPHQTLLSYRLGDISSLSTLPEGTIQRGDPFSLWIGNRPPGEPERESPQVPEALLDAASLSANQCQFLLETARRVGCVGEWRVIDGWVPAAKKGLFEGMQQNEAMLLVAAEESGLPLSSVPTLFHRPRALEGFAGLMGLYDTTAYREIDPTFLLAMSFSLMFGMMFADLGQGMLLFLAGYWLYHYRFTRISRHNARKIGLVLMPIGLSAALFGLLYGSVFSHEDWIPALLFHPMDNVLLYLMSAVLMGIALLCISMALGLFNAWRSGQFRQLLWSNYGPLGLACYLALILFAVGHLGQWIPVRNIGLGISCSGLMAMALHHFHGMTGEVFGMRLFVAMLESYDFVMKFVMQTLSFVRIAAFTFAHIALSTALMICVDMFAAHPWLAWLTLVVGNLFIIILEGLLVSIQALRLHFFELFSKFVSGGGVPFAPLVPLQGDSEV